METGVIILLGILGFALIIFIMYLISRGKGKIGIQLDKFNFTPGEVITGNLTLNLKKALDASALEVGLIGVSDSTNYNVSSGKGVSRSSSSKNIFDFSYPLDGEKIYNPGSMPYKFQIKIPENVLTKVGTGNQAVDNVIKTAMFVTGNNRRIKWYVTGRLKIGGFDIRKKIQINIA